MLRAEARRRASSGDASATFLLSLAMFLVVTAVTVIGLCREPLLLAGSGSGYRLEASVAGALFCAAFVPAYVVLLRRRSTAAVMAILGTGTSASLLGIFLLARVDLFAGLGCIAVTHVVSLIVMHVWSVAGDGSVDTALARLPWLALGASGGAVLPRALYDLMCTYLGVRVPLLLAAALLLAASGLVWLSTRRQRFQPDDAVGSQAPAPMVHDARFVHLSTTFFAWLIGFSILTAVMAAVLGASPMNRADAGASTTIRLAMSGLVGFLVSLALVRRPTALLLLSPAVAVVARVSMLAGAPAIAVLLGLAESAAAMVAVVASQALVLGIPRSERYLARAVLSLWVRPLGGLVDALLAGLIAASVSAAAADGIATLAAVATLAAAWAVARAFRRTASGRPGAR